MRKTDYDSRTVIFRSRQLSILMLILLFTVIISLWILQGMISELTWWKIGVPVCAVSSLLLLFPPTEEWEYKAWQAKPRKVEQHFDR